MHSGSQRPGNLGGFTALWRAAHFLEGESCEIRCTLRSSSTNRTNNMIHKFKIGETVIFRPRERSARAEGGTFTIIGFAAESRGEPIYRLKHIEQELSQVARESELTKY